MQCKVLYFFPKSGMTHMENMEAEINRWLSQGWKLTSTSSHGGTIYVFLTR